MKNQLIVLAGAGSASPSNEVVIDLFAGDGGLFIGVESIRGQA